MFAFSCLILDIDYCNSLDLDNHSGIRELPHANSGPSRCTISGLKDLVPLLVHASVLALHVQDIHDSVNHVVDAALAICRALDYAVDVLEHRRRLRANVGYARSVWALSDAGPGAIGAAACRAGDVDGAVVGKGCKTSLWESGGTLRGIGLD